MKTQTKEPLITIVDDEACVRESLSSLIRSAGYTANEYASAEEFLTKGWWEDSACLILDVRLPAMGGLELQRYLTERQRDRAVVFISGHATENEQTWAMMRGAVAFLQKPFSDESLLAAVRTAIARQSGGPKRNDGSLRMLTCPLCQELFPPEALRGYILHEQTSILDYTIEMIKTMNPEWVKEDGSCARCWKFYADLGRAVSFSRSRPVKQSGEDTNPPCGAQSGD